MKSKDKAYNRLINEKSPYLLQHAYNPVDWYPWGDEAFEKAKKEDKPIFLSIGYSTCHWCHVMERESFEDQEVADVLNRYFVSIKVDREERPDIDHIYMTVCQALTGSGGWPLTIIMTPEQKPFFAGTYFPKHSRMGMTGLLELLEKVRIAWEQDREALIESGESIIESLESHFELEAQKEEISKETIGAAYLELKESFDDTYGGFSYAPKFPMPHNLLFLLRYWKFEGKQAALDMVEKTLENMVRGGIFDHIEYGFSRYSTDQKWLVPHFEKMLYDNALLAISYLEAYQVTKKDIYARVARSIFTYVLRDMVAPEGGFYSAEDADSEGEEGKFYVWTPDEIKQILGEKDGELFCEYYGITEKGNFEGKSIPNRIRKSGSLFEDEVIIAPMRKKVFEYREKRVHPHKDDKILTSWNGLMIAALVLGGRILDEDLYTRAAERAVDFINHRLTDEKGRLLARYREGEAAYLGYLDDYAYFVWGLIELYHTTYNPTYLEQAIKRSQDMIQLFWDNEKGGFFLYGKDGEKLITRPKELYDGALPSGNSVAALNLIRLARLTGDSKLEDIALEQIRSFAGIVKANPAAYTYFLIASMFVLYPSREVVFVGRKEDNNIKEMIGILHKNFIPNTVSILYPQDERGRKLVDLIPLIQEYKPIERNGAVYVCRNFACQAPITDVKEFEKALRG